MPEPDASTLTIVSYKATHIPKTLIDDTKLVVPGKTTGEKIKYQLDQLDSWVGCAAFYVCTLACFEVGSVLVYRGEVAGQLVEPRGESEFGFNNWFLPTGSAFTFGEKKQNKFNGRYLAVQNLLNQKPFAKLAPLFEWSGSYQGK